MKKSYTKDNLDRFYTNEDVVEKLLKEFDFSQYDLIIEPSAGDGAFSKRIPGCLAFDICPQHENVIQQDFLSYEYDRGVSRERILCIGNPPYGRQSSLALKFIKKCSEFADTIAFILPLSFKKDSVQSKVPTTYHLMTQIDLDINSFTLLGDPYAVPSVFQIWRNQYQPRERIKKIEPLGFRYVNHGALCHFAVRRVGVYAGRAFKDCDKCRQSHYFLKLENELDVDVVIERLNAYTWTHGNTVGPRSISKQELNVVLNRILLRPIN